MKFIWKLLVVLNIRTYINEFCEIRYIADTGAITCDVLVSLRESVTKTFQLFSIWQIICEIFRKKYM